MTSNCISLHFSAFAARLWHPHEPEAYLHTVMLFLDLIRLDRVFGVFSSFKIDGLQSSASKNLEFHFFGFGARLWLRIAQTSFQ